jgi:ketosteroid isomerase-like protein
MSFRTLCAAWMISSVFAADNPREAVLTAQRQWLDGYNHHDAKALEAIEAEDFRVVFGDGKIQTKADQLTNIRKAVPAGATYEIAVESTEVRVYGNAAVLTGVVVEKGAFPDEKGAPQAFRQRSRYTDTWILEKGRWRVVSSHLSDLK